MNFFSKLGKSQESQQIGVCFVLLNLTLFALFVLFIHRTNIFLNIVIFIDSDRKIHRKRICLVFRINCTQKKKLL